MWRNGSMRPYFESASTTPALVGTLLATLFLVLVVFPALPIGGELLDVKSGYTCEEAVAALESYGKDGRRVYAWSSATLDTLLPALYTSLLAGLVYRFRPKERLWALAYVPVGAGALDLCENIQIIFLLVGYPDVSAQQVASASLFTLSKRYAFSICTVLAAVLAAVSAFTNRERTNKPACRAVRRSRDVRRH